MSCHTIKYFKNQSTIITRFKDLHLDIYNGEDEDSDDGNNVAHVRENVYEAIERMLNDGDENKELDMLKVCNKLDVDVQQLLKTVIVND